MYDYYMCTIYKCIKDGHAVKRQSTNIIPNVSVYLVMAKAVMKKRFEVCRFCVKQTMYSFCNYVFWILNEAKDP